MTDPLTDEAVRDGLLQEPFNLKLAASIERVLPRIRDDVAAAVRTDLAERLRTKLGADWQVVDEEHTFAHSYTQVWVARSSWKGRFHIALETMEKGRRTGIGVWRDREKVNADRVDEAVVEACRQNKFPARAGRWWTCLRVLPEEYGDWTDGETLARMHFQHEAFVKHLLTQFLALHKFAAPVIDRALAGSATSKAAKKRSR
jgi:hypothetical protein